ncbi:MAG: alpha-1,6-mannanase, partial [Proteobacteria bacterium]
MTVPKFLKKARECFDFILSGWDEKLGGGIYWYQKTRDGKNTCINAPGAAGALALY